MAWVLQCDRCEKIYSEKNEGYRRILLGYFKEGSEYKVTNIRHVSTEPYDT